MEEALVKVDSKGRILIPSRIRRRLGITRLVRLRVGEGKIIVEPVKDPLDALAETVIRGTTDVEQEIRRLRVEAERRAFKEAARRWKKY